MLGSAPAVPFLARESYTSSASVAKQEIYGSGVERIDVLEAVEDSHGGLIVEVNEVMDSESFSNLLRDSLSVWRGLVLSHFTFVIPFLFCLWQMLIIFHCHCLTLGKERDLD